MATAGFPLAPANPTAQRCPEASTLNLVDWLADDVNMTWLPRTFANQPSKSPAGCDTWSENGVAVSPQVRSAAAVGVAVGEVVFEKRTAVVFQARVAFAKGGRVTLSVGMPVVFMNGAELVIFAMGNGGRVELNARTLVALENGAVTVALAKVKDGRVAFKANMLVALERAAVVVALTKGKGGRVAVPFRKGAVVVVLARGNGAMVMLDGPCVALGREADVVVVFRASTFVDEF